MTWSDRERRALLVAADVAFASRDWRDGAEAMATALRTATGPEDLLSAVRGATAPRRLDLIEIRNARILNLARSCSRYAGLSAYSAAKKFLVI